MARPAVPIVVGHLSALFSGRVKTAIVTETEDERKSEPRDESATAAGTSQRADSAPLVPDDVMATDPEGASSEQYDGGAARAALRAALQSKLDQSVATERWALIWFLTFLIVLTVASGAAFFIYLF